MALMGTALRPSRADGAGFGRGFGCALLVGLVVAGVTAPQSSQAARIRPRPSDPAPSSGPAPKIDAAAPVPFATDINSNIAAGSTVIDLGSNFLRRLGNQA